VSFSKILLRKQKVKCPLGFPFLRSSLSPPPGGMDILSISVCRASVTLCPRVLSLSLIGSPAFEGCRKCRGPSTPRACWEEEAPESPSPCRVHQPHGICHLSLLPMFHYTSLSTVNVTNSSPDFPFLDYSQAD
jgi:hypothetical protein